VKAKNSKKNR